MNSKIGKTITVTTIQYILEFMNLIKPSVKRITTTDNDRTILVTATLFEWRKGRQIIGALKKVFKFEKLDVDCVSIISFDVKLLYQSMECCYMSNELSNGASAGEKVKEYFLDINIKVTDQNLDKHSDS